MVQTYSRHRGRVVVPGPGIASAIVESPRHAHAMRLVDMAFMHAQPIRHASERMLSHMHEQGK
eukprot:scaffold62813_cov20-Prasinocladus_malaysianus.AAC.1